MPQWHTFSKTVMHKGTGGKPVLGATIPNERKKKYLSDRAGTFSMAFLIIDYSVAFWPLAARLRLRTFFAL